MPTMFTNPAAPVAMALALGRGAVSGPLLAAGITAAILSDLDVLAFRSGIPYADALGHRGSAIPFSSPLPWPSRERARAGGTGRAT